jgi:hypothetical protein
MNNNGKIIKIKIASNMFLDTKPPSIAEYNLDEKYIKTALLDFQEDKIS